MPSHDYRMPPEWAPHDATWLSWPHNRETWPSSLAGVEAALTDAVVALAAGEVVLINVLDEQHRSAVRERFAGRVAPGRVLTHVIATDDAWCRDHGAIFVFDEHGKRVALNFKFNAWGGKYPFERDNAVPSQMAAVVGSPAVAVDVVLEGGSIDVNGGGVLLTTEQCLLNPNRNPSLRREDIEAVLRRYLGVRQVLWLGDGIVGDDTDGHVDDLTRFVAEATVVTVVEPDRNDENYTALAANLERLRQMRLADGRRLTIVELPMPEPVFGERGRLPASYANFYIGNSVVLLPVFDCPQDARAIDALARCFPQRRIVPIDCRGVVEGLGTLHCLTQQVPSLA
jgi:agmatine deiminase